MTESQDGERWPIPISMTIAIGGLIETTFDQQLEGCEGTKQLLIRRFSRQKEQAVHKPHGKNCSDRLKSSWDQCS